MTKKQTFIYKAVVVVAGALAALAMIFATLGPVSVHAVSDGSYDLTTDPGASTSVTINGAIWEIFNTADPTGSGVFEAFLRVQASPHEQGYNTDGRPLQYDETKSATFTHSFLLSDVPQIMVGGVMYREFQVDINENNGSPDWYLSLDEFQVWTTNDPNLLGYSHPGNSLGQGFFPDGIGTGQAKLVYDLDDDGNTYIKMDYRANAGSGKRDYRVFVPESAFAGKDLDYVVLFTHHGHAGLPGYDSDDGFEEWGVAVYPQIPDTRVQISTSDADDIVVEGQTIDLTVTETNTGVAPLYNVHVTVTYDSTTLVTLTDATALESITTDNVLEVGETWTWNASTNNELNDFAVNTTTTFTASGYGTTKEHGGGPGNIIVQPPDNPGELDHITIYALSTDVGISANPSLVIAANSTDLTVTEANDGSVDLINVSVVVKKDATTIATLTAANTHTGDSTDPGVLNPGETWTWTATGVLALNDVLVSGHTTFSADASVEFNGVTFTSANDADELASTTVDILSTDVSITPSATTVVAGQTIDLTITETNDGSVALTGISVAVKKDGVTFSTLTSSNPHTGDTTNPGTLDPSETWTWDATGVGALDNIVISTSTTFAADASVVYNGVTYTSSNDADELASTNVNVLSTAVDISASATTVVAGQTVNLTVTEANDGDLALDNVSVTVTYGATTINLTAATAVESGTNNDLLDVGETWTWSGGALSGITVNDQTTFTATGTGTAGGVTVTYPADQDERDTVTVNTLSTAVDITSDVQETYDGNVRLEVTETNDGDLALENVQVLVQVGATTIATLNFANLTSGDTTANGKLDVGETWTWDYTTAPDLDTNISVDTTFVATGSGTANGVTVTYPADQDEQDSVLVKVVGGATRTQGFWATHLNFTMGIFNSMDSDLTDPDNIVIDLGWKKITNINELMGIFWANNAKESTGEKRDPLCQARMIASQQALAAILNTGLANGANLLSWLKTHGYPTATNAYETIATILAGGEVDAIRTLGGVLGAYNESGDNVALPLGTVTGRANPQGAKEVAQISFADCITTIAITPPTKGPKK